MNNIYIYILIMAFTIFMIRVLPLTLIRKKIRNKTLRSFLYYVPYAVLAAMTFPSVFYATENTTYALVGTVVALVLSYLERGLTTVAVISVLAIYLCNIWG